MKTKRAAAGSPSGPCRTQRAPSASARRADRRGCGQESFTRAGVRAEGWSQGAGFHGHSSGAARAAATPTKPFPGDGRHARGKLKGTALGTAPVSRLLASHWPKRVT